MTPEEMVEVTYHQQNHQVNYKNTTPGVFFHCRKSAV